METPGCRPAGGRREPCTHPRKSPAGDRLPPDGGDFGRKTAHSPRCRRISPSLLCPHFSPGSGANSMNIHEYQAKEVLRGFGVPVPAGQPAFSVEEAVKAAEALGGPVWVVKAQIHAGGRGKGGGVKVVKSIEDVRKEAQRMLGMTLVTHQTGPHGRLVKRLYRT